MTKAKGRKNLTDRRGFMALAMAALGASLPGTGKAQTPAPQAGSPPAKPQTTQRARLPRRLAADFHGHIETRLPHLRAPFEAAAREPMTTPASRGSGETKSGSSGTHADRWAS